MTIMQSSIQWRLSIAASVVTIAVIACVSFLEIALIRSDLVSSITAQQTTFVEHVANELDSKLDQHLKMLAQSAAGLSDEDPEADAFVDIYQRQPGVVGLFERVTLIKFDGRAIASVPQNDAVLEINYANRAYFQSVLATGRPVISEPLKSLVGGRPIVVMAVPVLARSGRVTGVVAAVLRLDKPNVLGDLATEKIGERGYFFILTRDDHPVYVVHPDATRILDGRPANGSTTTTQALAGLRGTVEGTNSTGVHALFSYVGLRSTNWMLAAVLPTSEAFAAIENAVRRTLWIAFCAALLVAPLAWYAVWRVLSPLSRLAEAVKQIDGSSDVELDVRTMKYDEVKALVQSFNALVQRLRLARGEARSSAQWLQSITDNLPALVCYIDREHRFRFNNRTYERWLKRPVGEVTGSPIAAIYGDAVYATLRPSLDEAMTGQPTKFEVPFTGRDGLVHYARGRYVPHFGENGEVLGVFGLITDETRLKNAELALSASEKRLLDITNNIPAVIGQFDMDERCLFANDIGLKGPWHRPRSDGDAHVRIAHQCGSLRPTCAGTGRRSHGQALRRARPANDG